MTGLSDEILNVICPMHAVLDPRGHIRQAGPTLHKLTPRRLEGAQFLEAFEVYRPRAVVCMDQLLQTERRKIRLRLRDGLRTQMNGVLVADGRGGAVVNLSFGIHVVDAVRDYALTSTDFAPTDLAVEMLYLVEAKSAAMDASRNLNTRLQGAMVAAEERAFTDTLTGLRNRRALDTVLDRIRRSGEGFALMHIDLDFFKQVNDSLGHAAGDMVLRHVGRILTEITRKEDTAVRVGGDEFAVVFGTPVPPEDLAEIAERIIRRIEEPLTHDGRRCTVSASIGIALSQGGGDDPDAVLGQADAALYASKRSGRARYSFYQAAGNECGTATAAGE